MRRILLGSSALLIATLALAGCSAASSGGSSSDSGVTAPNAQAPADGGTAGDASGAEIGDGTSTTSVGDQVTDRQVIVTGDVTITADEPLTASRDAIRIVEAAGGRVDSRTEYAATNGDKGSAQLTLRIPADKLTATLDKLEALGKADSVSLNSSDVTVASQDLDARINALKATLERLNVLVTQATNITDLITLEGEISNRQGDLESLEAQQRDLADQVAMSTVNLYLRSVAEAPKVVPGDFWSGLAAGWGAFVAFWAGLLVVLGVLLPWIITAAIVTFLIVFFVRRHRRRVAVAAAAPATAAAPTAAAPAVSVPTGSAPAKPVRKPRQDPR